MVLLRHTTTRPPNNLLSASRKLVRRPAQRRKLTKAERDALKARNLETRVLINQVLEQEQAAIWDRATALHQQYGLHTREWWHSALIQRAARPKRVSKVTPWRAYVSKKLGEINDEKRQNGETCVRPADVSTSLAEEWKSMTKEEQIAATSETIEKLEAARKEATETVHNVSVRAFHDIRATTQRLQAEAEALASRAPVEILIAVARTDYTQYNKPVVFATSRRVDDFLGGVFKTSLAEFGLRLEAYMLSGIGGVTRNYAQSLSELKSEVARLIHTKLNEAAGRVLPGMKYVNFDKLITVPHRIVIKNWPIQRFANPSDIGGKTDLEILRNAWETGATYFEVLSDEEYNEFCATMGRARTEGDSSASGTLTNGATASVSTADTPPSVVTTPPATAPPVASESAAVASTIVTSAAPHHPTDPTSSASPSTASTSSDSSDAHASKRRKTQGTTFIQCVVGADGDTLTVKKGIRKTRKDKGVKRGSRKEKENVVPPSLTSADSPVHAA